ncbi:hypothetical protein EBI01_05600 [Marinomonas rhizomae]|uniref:Uncharacterized protein n=1 Tax=Marinomonas rhizomae TaxID=491948 RepID=A0A366JBA7_9GAMM|nr:hypothetical protein [Marinomonas rhizomae]RBP84252.1 hypothetical protein DFP80_104155 [Marinomonas rhizomae]RNF74574.1 hypothetical protein EBI01_05600 [Marinomonas rhizomae]
MKPAEIRILLNSHYKYIDQIKKINVDSDFIKELQKEHVLFIELMIKHMIKEKTIHRADEMIAFQKRMTNLMYVLFSSDASTVAFVDSIKSSFVKVDDKKQSDSTDEEESCSIEQALNELDLFEF